MTQHAIVDQGQSDPHAICRSAWQAPRTSLRRGTCPGARRSERDPRLGRQLFETRDQRSQRGNRSQRTSGYAGDGPLRSPDDRLHRYRSKNATRAISPVRRARSDRSSRLCALAATSPRNRNTESGGSRIKLTAWTPSGCAATALGRAGPNDCPQYLRTPRPGRKAPCGAASRTQRPPRSFARNET